VISLSGAIKFRYHLRSGSVTTEGYGKDASTRGDDHERNPAKIDSESALSRDHQVRWKRGPPHSRKELLIPLSPAGGNGLDLDPENSQTANLRHLVRYSPWKTLNGGWLPQIRSVPFTKTRGRKEHNAKIWRGAQQSQKARHKRKGDLHWWWLACRRDRKALCQHRLRKKCGRAFSFSQLSPGFNEGARKCSPASSCSSGFRACTRPEVGFRYIPAGALRW